MSPDERSGADVEREDHPAQAEGGEGCIVRSRGMYANGLGVPRNYVQAHKWFNLAAVRFTASESENRQRAVRDRDVVAAKMNASQIEAQRLAREWKPK